VLTRPPAMASSRSADTTRIDVPTHSLYHNRTPFPHQRLNRRSQRRAQSVLPMSVHRRHP
jgi:hypothetical protein